LQILFFMLAGNDRD